MLTASKLARVISTLFVPPAFTILTFTYFSLVLESESFKRVLLITVTLIFGFLLHIALFLYLRSKGKIADSDAMIKEERSVPFIIATLFYTAGFFILLYHDINILIIAFWFCYISNTILILFINKFWKISAHLMGAAGPMAALMFATSNYFILLIFLLFIIGWARLKLKCHTVAQISAGAIVGFFSTYIQMYLIIYFYG